MLTLLSGLNGVEALASGYLDTLARNWDGIGEETMGMVADTLCRLIGVACGAAAADQPNAVRAGRLAEARRLIDRSLTVPDLSAAWIAASLGISVRMLHLLFEPTGSSFARYVLRRRWRNAGGFARGPYAPGDRYRVRLGSAACPASIAPSKRRLAWHRAICGRHRARAKPLRDRTARNGRGFAPARKQADRSGALIASPLPQASAPCVVTRAAIHGRLPHVVTRDLSSSPAQSWRWVPLRPRMPHCWPMRSRSMRSRSMRSTSMR